MENDLEYRKLGKTDITVSEIGFGTGGISKLMVEEDLREQDSAVARALQNGITLEQLVSLQKSKRNVIMNHPTAVKRLKVAGVPFYKLKKLQPDLLDLVLTHHANVIKLLEAVTWEEVVYQDLETLSIIAENCESTIRMLKSGISWNKIVTLSHKNELYNEEQEITKNFLNQFDHMQQEGKSMTNRFLTCKQNQRHNDTSLLANNEESNSYDTLSRLNRLYDHLKATQDCNRNSSGSVLEIFKPKNGRSTWGNVCALLGVEETKIKEALARGKDDFNIWIDFYYLRSQESKQSENTNNP